MRVSASVKQLRKTCIWNFYLGTSGGARAGSTGQWCGWEGPKGSCCVTKLQENAQLRVSLTHSEVTVLCVRTLNYRAKWSQASHPLGFKDHLNGWCMCDSTHRNPGSIMEVSQSWNLFAIRHSCLLSLSDFIVNWKMHVTPSPDNHLQV